MSQSDSNAKFPELIANCDSLIKAGQIAQVQEVIAKLVFSQVPRTFRQPLAKICRRIGLVSDGLRLLQPVIRSEKKILDPPTPGEICEYSVLLSRSGSIQEAMTLLKSVNPADIPEALLYLAYCHISNWEYAEATGFLESYLSSKADDYSKLIARVNLASAYVETDRWESAHNLLKETIEIADKAGAARLVGNCHEISGQAFMFQRDFPAARDALAKASQIFGSIQSYDQLLISKTLAMVEAQEKNSVEPLLSFRAEAEKRQHWESVRETDLHSLQIRFEQKVLDRLYYGSPMKSFRQKVLKAGIPSETFVFGEENILEMDLLTGTLNKPGKGRASGSKIHQVISALVKDAYSPRNLGSLFAELYPNEYFDINSSPARVKQLMVRARQWFRENKLNTTIEQHEGAFQLLIRGGFGIRVRKEIPTVDPMRVKWEELKAAFPISRKFTADDACSKLNCSRSTFLRLSEWALASNELQKTGVGKSTRYEILPLSQSGKIPKVS